VINCRTGAKIYTDNVKNWSLTVRRCWYSLHSSWENWRAV